jgi:beta-glucosidase
MEMHTILARCLMMKMDPETIIKQMSLEQKASLCTGASKWTTVPFEDLGITSLNMADGPHGLRHIADETADLQQSEPATAFPTASLTAATWNRDLITKMGQALGQECVAQGVDIVLGPGVNMKRSPLCGRNFEYFSEDPYLAGEMGTAFVQGVQSQGVGTSLKHFAVNNQETQRLVINARLSERALREIYLPAFEKTVKQAQPYTVMCSYNKVNGPYASENPHLLTEILKEEWGFKGMVISDWGAVHDQVAALKAGLDLEMPGPDDTQVQQVVKAVRDGKLSEDCLNDAVRRILGVLAKAHETEKKGQFSSAVHHQLAAEVAAEGMVLLKNTGSLPLKAQIKVAVIGRTATEAHYQGNGSSHINPTQLDSPLSCLRVAAPQASFNYTEGYPVDDRQDSVMITDSVELAKASDVALLFIGLPGYIESEGYDRHSLDLTAQQQVLIQTVAAAQPNRVVILNNGAPVRLSPWIGSVAAVIEAYMMGQAGAQAIASILFGQVNPSGKLAETFPLTLEDTPAYLNFPGEAHEVWYGEGLYIGYRYYDKLQKEVQFPFGFGLSYTQFDFSNARVSASEFRDQQGVDISVDVTNVGSLPGKEVVQVYVRELHPQLTRPDKELKGFEKVELKPGETKTVKIHLDFRSFAYWHPMYHQWVADSDDFEILIAASSRDVKATLPVKLNSTQKLPCILNRESTIKEWEQDPYGGPFFRELKAMLVGSIGQDAIRDATLGVDYETLMQNDPLENILRSLPGMFIPDPIGMVDMMLEQVHARAKADQAGK